MDGQNSSSLFAGSFARFAGGGQTALDELKALVRQNTGCFTTPSFAHSNCRRNIRAHIETLCQSSLSAGRKRFFFAAYLKNLRCPTEIRTHAENCKLMLQIKKILESVQKTGHFHSSLAPESHAN